jgi:hypothetical protein
MATERLRLGTSGKALDATAVQQGLVKECPYRAGVTFTILPAAMWNPRFRQAVQNRLGRIALQKVNGEATKVANGKAAHETEYESRYDDPDFIASALVAGIDGLFNGKGNPVKYTPERAVQILSDPANWDVKEWLVNEALQWGQFYTQAVEGEAKN